MQYTFPDTVPLSDDTIGRDQLDTIMNELTRKYYGFILVMCPDCWAINARHWDDFVECINGDCAYMFRASEATDLFF